MRIATEWVAWVSFSSLAVQQAVDFSAVIILPEAGLAILAAMEGALDELADDQILEQRARGKHSATTTGEAS